MDFKAYINEHRQLLLVLSITVSWFLLWPFTCLAQSGRPASETYVTSKINAHASTNNAHADIRAQVFAATTNVNALTIAATNATEAAHAATVQANAAILKNTQQDVDISYLYASNANTMAIANLANTRAQAANVTNAQNGAAIASVSNLTVTAQATANAAVSGVTAVSNLVIGVKALNENAITNETDSLALSIIATNRTTIVYNPTNANEWIDGDGGVWREVAFPERTIIIRNAYGTNDTYYLPDGLIMYWIDEAGYWTSRQDAFMLGAYFMTSEWDGDDYVLRWGRPGAYPDTYGYFGGWDGATYPIQLSALGYSDADLITVATQKVDQITLQSGGPYLKKTNDTIGQLYVNNGLTFLGSSEVIFYPGSSFSMDGETLFLVGGHFRLTETGSLYIASGATAEWDGHRLATTNDIPDVSGLVSQDALNADVAPKLDRVNGTATNLSVSGTLSLNGDAITAWPSGGASDSIATPITYATAPIAVTSTQSLYWVELAAAGTVSNTFAGLTFDGSTRYAWTEVVNIVSNAGRTVIWDSRRTWLDGTPDLTVTGRYEFALSTVDGVRVRARQTWPECCGWVPAITGGRNSHTAFGAELFIEHSNASTTNDYVVVAAPFRLGARLVMRYNYYVYDATAATNTPTIRAAWGNIGAAPSAGAITNVLSAAITGHTGVTGVLVGAIHPASTPYLFLFATKPYLQGRWNVAGLLFRQQNALERAHIESGGTFPME